MVPRKINVFIVALDSPDAPNPFFLENDQLLSPAVRISLFIDYPWTRSPFFLSVNSVASRKKGDEEVLRVYSFFDLA